MNRDDYWREVRRAMTRPDRDARLLGLIEERAARGPMAVADLAPLTLACHARAVRHRALERVEALLTGLSAEVFAGVDRYARPWRWDLTDTGWVRVDDDARAGDDSVVALGLLAMHPNGFVRERATRRLGERGTSSLPWLLVRTADPVVAVCRVARSIVRERLREEGAELQAWVPMLPLLERLARSRRGDRELESNVIARLRDSRQLPTGLSHWDRRVRVRTFALLRAEDALTHAHLSRALDDGAIGMRLAAARELDASPAMAPLRAQALRSRAGRVRSIALERMVEAGEATDLVPWLSDPHRGVRQLARLEVRRRDPAFDFHAHHRRVLAEDLRVGAVEAMAELARAEDWPSFVPALEASTKTARAALVAIARLAPQASRALRWTLVEDARPGVSAEAARSLRSQVRATDEEPLRAMLASPQMHVRRAALRLATHLPGWRAAIVLLEAGPELQALATPQLDRWIAARWHRLVTPSHSDREQLDALLDAAAPPESFTGPVPGHPRMSLRGLLAFLAR